MNITVPEVQKMGITVLHWLCFQKFCGRGALLSELYLRQPMAEFFGYHFSGDVCIEFAHPNLKQKTAGRPCQIDVCLTGAESKSSITHAFELKWVPAEVFRMEDVVKDLLRLEMLRNSVGSNSIHRYFLMAGETSNFRKQLPMTSESESGGRNQGLREFLTFEPTEVMFAAKKRVTDLDTKHAKLVKDFAAAYTQGEVPSSIVTHQIFGRGQDGLSVYIWRVTSPQNRQKKKTAPM